VRLSKNLKCECCCVTCIVKNRHVKVLLATARERVYSPYKGFVIVRVLLDQGSVSTFIIESLAQRLRLVKINRSVCLTDIHEMQSVVHHVTQITITSAHCDRPTYSTTALILRSLTKYLPSRVNIVYNWKHIAGLKFANSDLMSSDPIDIIIGADLFGMLFWTIFDKVLKTNLVRVKYNSLLERSLCQRIS